MFYAGEPSAIKGREYRSFDWAAAERLVDDCLASYDLRTLAVPDAIPLAVPDAAPPAARTGR